MPGYQGRQVHARITGAQRGAPSLGSSDGVATRETHGMKDQPSFPFAQSKGLT
jgi:hypothetical protein